MTRQDRRSIRRSIRRGAPVDDSRLAEIARKRAAARVGAAGYRWAWWLPTACSGLVRAADLARVVLGLAFLLTGVLT